MRDKARERFLELCQQAAVEQDRDKLMQLIAEIERLLIEKEHRLKGSDAKATDNTASSAE